MTARRILLGLLSLLCVVVLITRYVRMRMPAHIKTVMSEDSSIPATSAPLGATWLATLDDDTPCDPHTSRETFMAFVAARVEEAVERVSGSTFNGARYVLSADVPADVANAVSKRIHALPPHDRLPRERGQDDTLVLLEWRNASTTTQPWWPTPMTRGTLVASVTGPKGSANVKAVLDEKPWLGASPAELGRLKLVVAGSTGPQGSEAFARRSLRDAAVEQLTSRGMSQLSATPGAGPVSPDTVRRQAEAEVDRGIAIDEAVIRMDRPYGPVWYAAQLLEAPMTSTRITQASIDTTRYERRTWASLLLALAGMMGVLAVVYAGLNALTRGYYRKHLLALVVMVLLVGGGVIVLFLA